MKNQNGSSRVDTVLKMMLIAFVSLLAFSSGVWFGKSLSDSDHKLKALESDFSSASHTAQMDSKREDGQEDPLAEEEVASMSEKFVTDQRDELAEGKSEKGETKKEARSVASEPTEKTTEKAHGAEKANAHEAAHETAKTAEHESAHPTKTAKTETGKAAKPDLSAAHEAAERVAHNGEPSESGKTTAHEARHVAEAAPAHGATTEKLTKTAATAHTAGHEAEATKNAKATTSVAKATVAANHNPEEAAPTKATRGERAPSSSGLPKTVGTAGEVEFTVQIAAFPTADLAKSKADDLVKKGFPAFPVEATVNGRTWFRVSVGSFKTMKEAAGYRVQLLKQAELNEAIVQRIQR